jgi:hypothetical protein
MSTAEMQACLARLYVDEPFRKLFRLDFTAIDEYWLTNDEASAIRAINPMQLDNYARSLRNKRRSRVERAYPIMFSIDQSKMLRYYARYYQFQTGRADALSPQQDVLDFGAFLHQSLIGADTLPPYAADICRYERLYYLVRFAPRLPQNSAGAKVNRIADSSDVPFVRRGVEIADFAYDVAAIEEWVRDTGRPPTVDEVGQTAASIAFRPATPTSAARMLRLNAATRAVIAFCDGRTASQIVAALEAAYSTRDLQRDIVDVLNRLLALEVLTLDIGAAADDETEKCITRISEVEGM